MTTKIIRAPGTGKTKEIMALCQKENATFVCKNPEALFVKSKAYGYEINIISYIEYLQNSSNYKKNVYFDDIDDFLLTIGCEISGFGGNA